MSESTSFYLYLHDIAKTYGIEALDYPSSIIQPMITVGNELEYRKMKEMRNDNNNS